MRSKFLISSEFGFKITHILRFTMRVLEIKRFSSANQILSLSDVR